MIFPLLDATPSLASGRENMFVNSMNKLITNNIQTQSTEFCNLVDTQILKFVKIESGGLGLLMI